MSVQRRLAIATLGFRGRPGGGSTAQLLETIDLPDPMTVTLEPPIEVELVQLTVELETVIDTVEVCD